jgi:hypothetical protein
LIGLPRANMLGDLVDVWDDISFSERLSYTQDMEQMLRELERLDVRVHVASRSTARRALR